MARSPVEQYLRDQFLDEGSLNWQALGATVSGSVLAAFLSGLIRLPLALGEAFERAVRPIRLAIDVGGQSVATEISSVVSSAWAPWDFGLVTLPVVLAAVLVAFLVFAWGWNRYA